MSGGVSVSIVVDRDAPIEVRRRPDLDLVYLQFGPFTGHVTVAVSQTQADLLVEALTAPADASRD